MLATQEAEQLVTLKQAASVLGVPYFKLRAAAKAGVFDTYRLYNSRALVRVFEIVAAIDRTRSGSGR